MRNHRQHDGPEEMYESTGLIVYKALKENGLLPSHKLLDVGCGSLRVGKVFIIYLNKNNYYGVEPDKEILELGIKHELSDDLIDKKNPQFFNSHNFDFSSLPLFDYVLAHDVFYHCGKDQFRLFLKNIYKQCKCSSKIIVTVMFADGNSHETTEGLYNYKHASHKNVYYELDEFKRICKNFGFFAKLINKDDEMFFSSRLYFEIKKQNKFL